MVLVSVCSIVSPTCFSVLHSLWYSHLMCSTASPTPVRVFRSLWYSYPCVPLSLQLVSLCYTLSGTRTWCVPLPFLLLSLFFTVFCSCPSVPLPLYVWQCIALSLCLTVSRLLLSLCSFACHVFISELHCLILLLTRSIASLLISLSYTVWYSLLRVSLPVYLYMCYTASATVIPVFLCLSTSISVLYCLWYSYPYDPSPLYLYLCVLLRLLCLSLSSIASLLNISVFYCLFSSCSCVPLPRLFVSLCSITCTSHILIFHRLCYLYLCLPYPCTCVVLTLHALSVTHITSFIFVCVAVVIGIGFV